MYGESITINVFKESFQIQFKKKSYFISSLLPYAHLTLHFYKYGLQSLI